MIAKFVEFRRTFALVTCEISCTAGEISKSLTKFHRIFPQEKCEISFCFGEISESVTKFRQIFALEVCKISKGETSFRSKGVQNFVLPELTFGVGSMMAALILAQMEVLNINTLFS